jgi:hypothetical protein
MPTGFAETAEDEFYHQKIRENLDTPALYLLEQLSLPLRNSGPRRTIRLILGGIRKL